MTIRWETPWVTTEFDLVMSYVRKTSRSRRTKKIRGKEKRCRKFCSNEESSKQNEAEFPTSPKIHLK